MNELIPNAASLTLRTLIPAAAAARSFERTASIRCPSAERRRFATVEAEHDNRSRGRRTRTPGSAPLSSMPRKGPYGPRSMPSLGSGTGELDVPPPHVELRKDELLDRHRGGERDHRQGHTAHTQRREPDQDADTVAPQAPISITSGNPTPWSWRGARG
jgi:hypothetical protein